MVRIHDDDTVGWEGGRGVSLKQKCVGLCSLLCNSVLVILDGH